MHIYLPLGGEALLSRRVSFTPTPSGPLGKSFGGGHRAAASRPTRHHHDGSGKGGDTHPDRAQRRNPARTEVPELLGERRRTHFLHRPRRAPAAQTRPEPVATNLVRDG